MTETRIYLDSGDEVRTRMAYSDVLNVLTKSTGFVEFTNTAGGERSSFTSSCCGSIPTPGLARS